jgi:hypothetical protein
MDRRNCVLDSICRLDCVRQALSLARHGVERALGGSRHRHFILFRARDVPTRRKDRQVRLLQRRASVPLVVRHE